jgi:hypothetical protein
MARLRRSPADGLRDVPPREFVGARTALAARLAREGKTAEARQVARLRRPSPVVWALNRVAIVRPRDIQALVGAVDRLRRAQLGGGDLRSATADYRAELDALVRAAGGALKEAATTVSAALDPRHARGRGDRPASSRRSGSRAARRRAGRSGLRGARRSRFRGRSPPTDSPDTRAESWIRGAVRRATAAVAQARRGASTGPTAGAGRPRGRSPRPSPGAEGPASRAFGGADGAARGGHAAGAPGPGAAECLAAGRRRPGAEGSRGAR